MYKIFLRVFFFITGIGLSGLLKAQDSLKNEKPHMADLMRSNGKIYVVVDCIGDHFNWPFYLSGPAG